MSALSSQAAAATAMRSSDPRLAHDVLAHLEAQIQSTQRLVEAAFAQGDAIRTQDVDGVMHHAIVFQAEIERRASLDEDRSRLLERCGAQLGVAPEAVTLSQLTALMAPAQAALATGRSAELQELLTELTQEHTTNQALMRQELAFLDHLLRKLDPAAPGDAGGYTAGGTRPETKPGAARPSARALDLQA